jgi:hypothetical protein
MQQRQPRLGEILDDYCPRERRVTNHVVVAMIGEDVKQVRCTTCDADHDFKHAKVPRQRRKTETPAALYAQVLATGPKRIPHDSAHPDHAAAESPAAVTDEELPDAESESEPAALAAADGAADLGENLEHSEHLENENLDEDEDNAGNRAEEDGPIHRRLIRASLPKIDGAPPPTRQIPEFTIRQPAGRPANRFRPRGPGGGRPGGGGGGQQFQGNRSNGGGGNMHGGPRGAGGMRSNGGRPPQGPGGGQMRRNGPGGGRRRPK